jgi:hypothetical protein
MRIGSGLMVRDGAPLFARLAGDFGDARLLTMRG